MNLTYTLIHYNSNMKRVGTQANNNDCFCCVVSPVD